MRGKRWMCGLALGAMVSMAAGAAAAQATSGGAGELARLKQALRLTSAQEPSWTAYEQGIGTSGAASARHRSTEEMLPGLTTPRRLSLIEATMEADLADFRRHASAVTAFYGQLTPSQQKVFDIETLPPKAQR